MLLLSDAGKSRQDFHEFLTTRCEPKSINCTSVRCLKVGCCQTSSVLLTVRLKLKQFSTTRTVVFHLLSRPAIPGNFSKMVNHRDRVPLPSLL